MGINIDIYGLLLKEALRKPFSGTLLTFGRMDVLFTLDELENKAAGMGVSLRDCDEDALSPNPQLASQGFVSGEFLLKKLGFTRVDSLDVSDYEGADILFDLCLDKTPDALLEQYDVVLDSGASEHIFHIPNFLRHIFHALRMGGRAIHISPSLNYMEHGYYMFSPILFWDFYNVNRFNVKTMSLYWDGKPGNGEPSMKYVPGFFVPPYGSPDGLGLIMCCVAKNGDPTGHIIPRQNPGVIRDVIEHDMAARRYLS